MEIVANALVVLVVAIHVYIVILEMFLWRTERGMQAFGTDQAFADRSAPLAANQGLYNGFLVAGLVWGLLAADPIGFQVKVFFLACVVVAGLYGAATVSRRILVVQAAPGGARPGRPSWPRPTSADGRLLARSQAASQERTPSSRLEKPAKEPDRDDRHAAEHPPDPSFDPDDDDRLIGRVLSRREVLALMGAGTVGRRRGGLRARFERERLADRRRAAPARAASHGARRPPRPAAVASALPSCVVVPELTEGPYYVNENLDRSDIRIDTADGSVSEGAVLTLDWVVSQVDGSACIPLEGVLVDVWHCDALGNYSDVGERAGPRLPARLPAHRRERQGDDRHDLPGLVPGPRGPHPLQDPDRRRRRRAASSSPRSCSSTTPSAPRSTPPACTPRRAPPTSSTRPTASTSRARG